ASLSRFLKWVSIFCVLECVGSFPLKYCLYGGSSSARSEEHTSELQSRFDIVCRLLLEKNQVVSSFISTSLNLIACTAFVDINFFVLLNITFIFFFGFYSLAYSDIFTLSLHDALPICLFIEIFEMGFNLLCA